MTITVNGDTVTIADNATVADLMAERHLTSAGTAVAVNAAVVPASTLSSTSRDPRCELEFRCVGDVFKIMIFYK